MNNKSKEKRVAARNRVAAGKRAGWPLSPTRKKGFEGFAGFVTKRKRIINNQIITTMKKSIIIAVLMALALSGMAQEIIWQPSSINLYWLGSDGQENAFYDHVTFQYDSCGLITQLKHTINYPYPEIRQTSYEYDSVGNLTYKFYSYLQGSNWYGNYYYYTYDQQSNLTELYVEEYGRMYLRPKSRRVYEYTDNTLTKMYYYYYNLSGGEMVLANHIDYVYSDDGKTKTETKISANDLPVGRDTYIYSDNNELTSQLHETVDSLHQFVNQHLVNYEYNHNELVSKTEMAWSKALSVWVDSTYTEYRYENGLLVQKDFTRWAADTLNSRTQEQRSYDDYGNCILILYKDLVNGALTETNRAFYAYDENNLCIAALAQTYSDSAWVKGLFSHSEPLFLNAGFDHINKELGTLQNRFRAEVAGYVSTPNPYFAVTEIPAIHCTTFPNPGNGVMKVSCDLDNASIHIFDMHGRWVKSQRINNGITPVVMDDVPSGLYVWQIWSDGTMKTSGKWINN